MTFKMPFKQKTLRIYVFKELGSKTKHLETWGRKLATCIVKNNCKKYIYMRNGTPTKIQLC